MKCVLSAALLGVPLAAWAVVRSTGGNPWWVFITFPVAYGYAFMWGFVSFVVAAPVALIAIEVTRRYNAHPSNRRALGLAALVSAVFCEADLPPNKRTNPLYHRSSGTGAWSFSSAVSCPSIRVSRAARGDDCMGLPRALKVPSHIYETSLGNRRLW